VLESFIVCIPFRFFTVYATMVLGNRAVKFQPKPKGQSTRKTNTAVVVSHLPDAANVPSENQHIIVDGLIRAGEPVTVSDLSHVRLDDDFGTEATIGQLDTVVLDDVNSVVTLHFSKEVDSVQNNQWCTLFWMAIEVFVCQLLI